VAIGNQVLDLRLAAAQCPWADDVPELLAPLADGDLNAFMALGTAARQRLREALSAALAAESDQGPFLELCLLPQAEAQMALPCRIGDYTDFYTGIHHATAVGKLFRPDNPLLPNYKWVPIGYHGRVSSIGVSGQQVKRPMGQTMFAGAAAPGFGPSQRLDYELELGLRRPRQRPGQPVTMEQAEARLVRPGAAERLVGARSPGLGVPAAGAVPVQELRDHDLALDRHAEALAPYRVPFAHPAGEPQPLPYLSSAFNRRRRRARHHAGGLAADEGDERAGDSWWTVAQLLAHHTASGCNLQTGDLLGSGTQSGPGPDQGGSLLELTHGGKAPLTLSSGETRTFLQDGDTVILRAFCAAPGRARIGLGEARGTIAG
jgi:fumarylacetoacetase